MYRTLCAATLALALVACGDGTQQPTDASGLELQHALAQEGLAIALASTVLQSQIVIALTTTGGANGGLQSEPCTMLTGGGSYRSLPIGSQSPTQAGVYYDAACQRPFVIANVQQVGAPNADSVTVNETAAYTGPTGTSLGSLTLHETAAFAGHLSVHGLGIFTPANGQPAIHLGLTCSFDVSGASSIPCQGGVVQDFPALSRSIGSVTPLTLVAEDISGGTGGVTFSGTGANLLSGPLGSLTLSAPTASTLEISGGTAIGTTSTMGSAATFSLFPPTPTSWTIDEAAHKLRFSISVVDNIARNSAATIVNTQTGATLTRLTLDQSGTGTITYSDGSSAAVTGWLLGDASN